MDIIKHKDYFNPLNDINRAIHIIGCGAVGSTLATMLTRLGITSIHLWDFDIVTEHNLTNQTFFHKDINKDKVDALEENLIAINPNIKIIKHPEGWSMGQKITGYIFIGVDNIDLRRQIIEDNKLNITIDSFYDFRMRLTDAQHYACTLPNTEYLLSTMNFTHEEAKEETPISACGTTLNVIQTVQTLASVGIANFINHIKEKDLKKCILIDVKTFNITAFKQK